MVMYFSIEVFTVLCAYTGAHMGGRAHEWYLWQSVKVYIYIKHAQLWTNAKRTRIFDGGWDNDILIKVIVFNLPN